MWQANAPNPLRTVSSASSQEVMYLLYTLISRQSSLENKSHLTDRPHYSIPTIPLNG